MAADQLPDDVTYGRQLFDDIRGAAFSALSAKEQVLGDFTEVLQNLQGQGLGLEVLDRFGKLTADDVQQVRDGLEAEIAEMKAAAVEVVGNGKPVVGEATAKLARREAAYDKTTDSKGAER